MIHQFTTCKMSITAETTQGSIINYDLGYVWSLITYSILSFSFQMDRDLVSMDFYVNRIGKDFIFEGFYPI